MPHDPHRIITTLSDVEIGIKAHMVTLLAGIVDSANVTLAFNDTRGIADGDQTFPAATTYLYDIQYDAGRKYGGMTRVVTTTATTASIKSPPTPVNLFFQLDTYATKRTDDWAMVQRLMPAFSPVNQQEVTTTDGVKIPLNNTNMETLHEITSDNLWRRAYRFRCPLWFADAATARSEYLVLQRRLTMNDEVYEMEALP